jgi:hypothetical protein
MNDQNDFINNINRNKDNGDMSFFDKGMMSNLHNKIINRISRVNQNNPQDQRQVGNIMDEVIMADMNFRNSLKELAYSLYRLNDADVAQKLMAEHIMMLNEIFKDFEKK